MFYLNTAYVSLAAAMTSHSGATSGWSPPKYIFNRRSRRKSLLATAWNAVALLCELRQTSLCPSVNSVLSFSDFTTEGTENTEKIKIT